MFTMVFNLSNIVSKFNGENLIWKEFKSSTIINVCFENNIMLKIIFLTDNGIYSIFNKVEYNKDKDDYSRICIEKINMFHCDNKTKYFLDEKILKVFLIRDKISWNFNNDKWIVVSDIGVKIYTKSFEIVILTIDDMSTRVELYFKKNNNYLIGDKINFNQNLLEHWAFKTDTPTYLKRYNLDI